MVVFFVVVVVLLVVVVDEAGVVVGLVGSVVGADPVEQIKRSFKIMLLMNGKVGVGEKCTMIPISRVIPAVSSSSQPFGERCWCLCQTIRSQDWWQLTNHRPM